MRTIENSKVGLAEKMDYLIFAGEKYSSCQQTRMPSSTKSDDGDDQIEADFTEEVEKLTGSQQQLISYKEYKELFRISDKTIALEAKNLLSDSGCVLPDSEEDETTSLDSDNGTLSGETTDPDSEGQDEDLEYAERGALKVQDDELSASQDVNDNACGDSCKMTYIELDLSSQSHEDVSDVVELMMRNLKIGSCQMPDSYSFDSSDPMPVKVCSIDECPDETDVEDPKLDEISEKQVLNLPNDVKSNGAMDLNCSSGHDEASSDHKPEFLGSFLPITASSLLSLPEKTYFQIAERLLDEETPLRLNAEGFLFNSDSCRTTSNTHDIPFAPSEMESSSQDLKSLFTPEETDSAYKMCSMTYVELDINEPCPDDQTLNMLNNLNIKDDKSPLCRGNPSDQNPIQTHPLCSELDECDFEVPTVDLIDDPPFLIDRVNTEMDLNSSLTNVFNVSSMPDFYSTQTFPSFSTESNFNSTPSFSNDCITFKPCPEVERPPSGVSSPRCSVLPPGAASSSSPSSSSSSSIPYDDSSFDVSIFDSILENGEVPYENPYVTENLHKLKEIHQFLGLSSPEVPQTILSPPPPPPPSSSPPPLSSTTVPPHFSRQSGLTNLTPTENPFSTPPRSLDSNAIPRVTTQTLCTQSEAIPAIPGIYVVLTTRHMHGLKRPTGIEMSEPAKKPFGFDNLNNSGLSEADSRKKAKQVVASLTDKQLLEFNKNESRLHEAVRSTNYEYVLALLKRLRNLESHNQDIINSKNDRSQTPLHLAVQANIPAIVHLLIKYGAEVNHIAMTSSKKLEAPLHYVASQGIQFKLVLKCLLEANDLDINIKNSEGQTALHCAAVAHGTAAPIFAHPIDSEYIIKKLLKSGADPLIQDNNCKNVLMYAIESKDLNLVSQIMKTVRRDCIQQLLTATTSNGQTCLGLALSLKEQFTQIQWEKLINLLIRHTSNN